MIEPKKINEKITADKMKILIAVSSDEQIGKIVEDLVDNLDGFEMSDQRKKEVFGVTMQDVFVRVAERKAIENQHPEKKLKEHGELENGGL